MANNDGLAYPQDFSLDSCRIITATNTPIEFRNMVVEIDYFEDLFNMTISGALVVNDSNGYINALSMSGNEFLILSFSKPGTDAKLEKIFRIHSITGRRLTKDQNENYIINFCSEETVLSEQYKISKSYNSTKISEMVKDIVLYQMMVRPEKFKIQNLEETSGVRDIVIPNLKPFEAISWLSTQAISLQPKTEGSPYLFFENIEGFNFKSLQSMYSKEPYKTYRYEPKNLTMPDDPRVQDMTAEITNVLSYEILTNFDTINSINEGGFANRLIAVDTIRQNYSVNDFDYAKYFQNAQKLNPFMIMTNAQNRKGDFANTAFNSVLKSVTTNTGQVTYNPYIKSHQPDIKDINIEQTVPHRTAQLSHINTVKYKISVPGDPLLTVGNVVEFLIPDPRLTDDGGRMWDVFYRGNFLITAVRHKIDQENKFITILELSKESLSIPYDVFDNSMAAWKDIRSR